MQVITNRFTIMKHYETIDVLGRTHVLTESRNRGLYPDANYLGTRLALCGILQKKESLEQWIKRTKKD